MYNPDQMYDIVKMQQEDIRRDEARRRQARQLGTGEPRLLLRMVQQVTQRVRGTKRQALQSGAISLAHAEECQC